ncbi:HNH endonuclease [Dillenia turbinata]|uniref:HNH endonuclease n=1 Tax=Dillenia turbinata TaxID=194707 RepID=A0AAN8V1H4_9MAGN
MRPTKEERRRRGKTPTGGHQRSISSSGFEPKSPNSRHSTLSPPQSSFLNDFYTQDQEGLITDPNPRSFPYSVKQQCWDKAEKIKGRDPDRWRRDPLGNIVFRKLVGCPGCLCHDYDHIVPYSKGGKSTLENCQVLQATVNRSKGNRTEISRADLIQKSSYCRVSGRDMDLLELSAYGNVRRGQDSGGCSIQ